MQPRIALDQDVAEGDFGVKEVYDYLRARSQYYGPMSDITTVGSDTFAVTIKIELYEVGVTPPATLTAGGPQPLDSWYYLAVIDRSNCTTAGQVPAVVLFTQIK